jgi:aspartyl-tRNA(Asn)/glutamyl-tRNA(Gln) amidotransferase subunit A
VEDIAVLLKIIAGPDELDPTSSDSPIADYAKELEKEVSGLNIGVPTNYFFENCDKEVSNAVKSVVTLLEDLGCHTVEFEFPDVPEIMAAYTTLDSCEASAVHERFIAERAGDFQPDSRLLLEQGLFIPATYYIHALRFRAMIFPKIMSLFRHFDVMVTPTEPMVAPQVGEQITVFDRYVAPFNLVGLPALSVPCGFSRGLPIGVQMIGKAYDESTILKIGHAYEQATDWHMKFPETL